MPSLFHPPLVHSFPLPVAACPFLLNSTPSNTGPFRFISRRGPSVRIVSLSVPYNALPFHLAASPVLPEVPYLRMWATRLVSGDLLPLEAALATVAPLEQTAQCAVVQPFAHGLRVLGVHHEDAPAGTVSDAASATRSPEAELARSGRSQRPHSAPSGSWNGILRYSTNTVPSITFLKAVSLLERVPGTRRRAEQASLKKPLIW